MAASARSTAPVQASCHCGTVTLQPPSRPREINECQCTLCRRYGAAWAYYDPKEVVVKVADSSPTRTYCWGDRDLEFHFCSVCGCVTHWKSIRESSEMGVNTRLMNPEDVRAVTRKIDYEAASASLRAKDTAHPEDRAQY